MNIQEKLDFFQQLIQCNHNLPLHSFSPDFVFAHSDILEDISSKISECPNPNPFKSGRANQKTCGKPETGTLIY